MRNIQITVVSPHFLKRVQKKDSIPIAIFLHFTECFSKILISMTRFCGFLSFNYFKRFYPGPEFTSNPRNITAMMKVAQEKQVLWNFSVAALHNPLIFTCGILLISMCKETCPSTQSEEYFKPFYLNLCHNSPDSINTSSAGSHLILKTRLFTQGSSDSQDFLLEIFLCLLSMRRKVQNSMVS